jgi:glycosyltransferase involved in cell wall biosynthesis
MHVLVSTPYPLTSPKGNTITAKRIVRLLEEAGHRAEVIHTDMPPCADAMIALHATKTLSASMRFKTCCPNSKLIINLTGTDIYKDQVNKKPEFYEALDLADHLVTIQEASLESVPEQYRHKTSFIAPSVLLPEEDAVPAPPPHSVLLAAHLRPVKNPFLINKALELLPDLNLHAFTLGAALEPAMAQQARDWQTRDPRFQWIDNVPYPQALSWMRQVDFTLNTSHSEGGSNAILESIMLGTPVLASHIEGNRGLLGDDYLGYFEPDNAQGLATLIERALSDSNFKAQLQRQTLTLQSKFSPTQERDNWLHLLQT